jgi:hypothetical protein
LGSDRSTSRRKAGRCIAGALPEMVSVTVETIAGLCNQAISKLAAAAAA